MRLCALPGTLSAIACLCLSFIVIISPTVGAITATDWRAGRIIDDGVFTDKNAMSIAQIQAFLNSKVPTCDTWGNQPSEFGGGTRAQYGASHGNPAPFTCLKDYYEVSKTTPGPELPANNYGGKPIPAGAQSAAQHIWNAAQKYNINPKVLLVKIATESAGPLTTDDWPFLRQYTYAMGSHCPDSGEGGSANCDPNYAGFSIQIDSAADLMRWYLESMNQSWWQYKKPYQNNNILWNVAESNCGGSNVYIESMATAALYTYTPYQPNQTALNNMYGTGDGCSAYGNRNFWRVFNDWFGSTQFTQPIGASLYHQQSSGKIYLVSDSTRYQVPDWDMMINYGLNYYPVQTVSDSIIQGLTDGGLLTNLVYDNNGVYLVNNRTRHPITQDMCTVWALSCFDGSYTKPLGGVFQTQYLQTGGLLPPLMKTNGLMYKLSTGAKQPIANERTLNELGLGSTPALSASVVNSRQPLGTLLITTPGVIQFSPDPHIYYFDGANYFTVGDMSSYYDWNLRQSPYLTVPTSSYNAIPPPTTLLNSWIISNDQKYIVDQGRKLKIPSSLADLWPESQYTTPPSVLFNALPTDTMSQLVLASPYVYLLDAGKKHYVQTLDEYSALTTEYGKVTSVRLSKVSSIPQGHDALVDGSLIIVQNGSGIIYVVNNNKLTHVPSPNVFDAYGYNWSAVRGYPTSITEDYAPDGKILYNGIASDGTHYIVSGSTLYQLSGPLAQDFGAIDSKFTPISKQAVKRSAPTLSRFLLNNDDGRVYYASGGSLHYVSSYESFIRYGGGYTPRVPVNTQTIQSFLLGQPL